MPRLRHMLVAALMVCMTATAASSMPGQDGDHSSPSPQPGSLARELYLRNTPWTSARPTPQPDGSLKVTPPSDVDILSGNIAELSGLIAAKQRELDALESARDLLRLELSRER